MAPPVGVFSPRSAGQPAPVGAAGNQRRKILVVTNDFPPRLGGIQSFVHNTLAELPAEDVVVYASDFRASATFDAAQPYPVIRHPTGLLVPTPAARRRVVAVLREHGARAVWFGAAAPLGALGPALRAAGAERLVATTHGHEVGWAQLPGVRSALRRIADGVDVITYLGEFTHSRLARVIGDRAELAQLAPGVDSDRFRPGLDVDVLRRRYGVDGHPLVVCVSRLVPRKGQDALIDAWPAVVEAIPGARLLIVGEGRYERSLRGRVERRRLDGQVVFTGAVSAAELPAHVAAGDVFAMPCRTRRGGLDVEGLGIVYLEASACARPVVAGRSGGAPEAVLVDRTGYVVDGRQIEQIAAAVVTLLGDPHRCAEFGAAGRAWVEQHWQWSAVAARLDALLQK